MIHVDETFDIKFLDASRISRFSRCEAYFLFECLMGLKPQDDNQIPLDYGTVMHVVLPEMFSGDSKKAFEVFDETWKKYPYGEEDPKRNTARARLSINNFVASHAPSQCPYEIQTYDFAAPSELISRNEIPFLIDVGLEYPLAGRIDMPVRWKATGKLWAYDFKTSSEISDRYFGGFWMSPQACVYTIALNQITQEPVEGIIYEAMRVSKSNVENQVGFVWVHDYHVEKFLDELKGTIARIKIANASCTWNQNFALCSTYASFGYPCKVCKYKMICDLPEWQDGARFFKRTKPFDPLEMKDELKQKT
jgi:hypothetical protein